MMVHPARIRALNRTSPVNGDYVLYWMQSSQRVAHNQALQLAVSEANARGLPVVVVLVLVPDYVGANERHYRFMVAGWPALRQALNERAIALVCRSGDPVAIVRELAQRAALVVADCGYLRHHRAWYSLLAQQLPCPLLQVEANIVVPLAVASDKEEYAARTLRPKLQRRLPEFLTLAGDAWPRYTAPATLHDSALLDTPDPLQSLAGLDRSVSPVSQHQAGEAAARQRLEALLEHKLAHYAEARNDPALDSLSHLSPYLHLGQLSPVEVAHRALAIGGPGADAFVEELVVRRELAINYCAHNPAYDTYAGLPAWAQRTLAEHALDPRPRLYDRHTLEQARTADPYWNAAQREMLLTGKMHGYMRMYWGKKVLEWSATPAEAFTTLVYLNDRYELDGRDPNGYAGIAWCFGKHDRPWPSRPVLGSVRTMSASGLARKFDMAAYVTRVGALETPPAVLTGQR